MSTAAFHVDDTSPGGARLRLLGRVTVADAVPLRDALLALSRRNSPVTVDCSAAEYLDVSAVQLLIALGRELAHAGQGCEVAGASPRVSEDLRLVGFLTRPGA
jgi:anti-anti-sigma regulatory factor